MAGKLQGLMSTVAGRNVYLRFNCFAGDAMGMNMVSKGVLAVVDLLQEVSACGVRCEALFQGCCKWWCALGGCYCWRRRFWLF